MSVFTCVTGVSGGGKSTLVVDSMYRALARKLMGTREAPLAQLLGSAIVITTIADVTFYGQDQVGNQVTVTGSIQIDFGDFRNQ